MAKASTQRTEDKTAEREEEPAAFGFSEVTVHRLSVGLDALRSRVLKMPGMALSLHVAGGTEADKPALMAYKEVVDDQLPHLRAGSHLHYLVFSKHTSTLLLTEGDGDGAVVRGGGTFRMLRSKEGTMAIEVLVLAVSASAQGQGHGTRIVNGMKALALAEADRAMTTNTLSTRGRGACGCLMVTQADAGASTVRFWRRQRLETGAKADQVVTQSQHCGKHGGTFVVYENTVNMLVMLDLESVYVRPKWRKWTAGAAADGAAAVVEAAENHEDLTIPQPLAAAAEEPATALSDVEPAHGGTESQVDREKEQAVRPPVASDVGQQARSPCTTTTTAVSPASAQAAACVQAEVASAKKAEAGGEAESGGDAEHGPTTEEADDAVAPSATRSVDPGVRVAHQPVESGRVGPTGEPALDAPTNLHQEVAQEAATENDKESPTDVQTEAATQQPFLCVQQPHGDHGDGQSEAEAPVADGFAKLGADGSPASPLSAERISEFELSVPDGSTVVSCDMIS